MNNKGSLIFLSGDSNQVYKDMGNLIYKFSQVKEKGTNILYYNIYIIIKIPA